MSTSATCNGSPVFGDAGSFSAQLLPSGGASDIDSFLSLSPGTTVYGAGETGRLLGISGVFVGPTSATVASGYGSLVGFVDVVSRFTMPPGETVQGGLKDFENVYFSATDIIVGEPSEADGLWSLSYKVALRVIG